MAAMGNITSKNLGRASKVNTQNAALDAPDSMINSKNFKDWVKRMIAASTIAVITVTIARFLKTYRSKTEAENLKAGNMIFIVFNLVVCANRFIITISLRSYHKIIK